MLTNAVIFLTHGDNLHKKAQRTTSRQLSCSNASRCVLINKRTRWTMEHASAVTAETNASSSIRLIKNHSKILKLLQFEKVQLTNPDFWSFWKKVRHRIHYILTMKQKTRFNNFGNIGYRYRLSVHEWPIYRYRPPKSHVGRSLPFIFNYFYINDVNLCDDTHKLMPFFKQARGRATWSSRATWCPRAPCWWPVISSNMSVGHMLDPLSHSKCNKPFKNSVSLLQITWRKRIWSCCC